jgi:hypothetical protein
LGSTAPFLTVSTSVASQHLNQSDVPTTGLASSDYWEWHWKNSRGNE